MQLTMPFIQSTNSSQNPATQLEELTRRQSEMLPRSGQIDLPTSPSREIPDRKLPESAVPVPATGIRRDTLPEGATTRAD